MNREKPGRLNNVMIVHTAIVAQYLIITHIRSLISELRWVFEDIGWAIYSQISNTIKNIIHPYWPSLLRTPFEILLIITFILLIKKSKALPWIYTATYAVWALCFYSAMSHSFIYFWDFTYILEGFLLLSGIAIPVFAYIGRGISRIEKY